MGAGTILVIFIQGLNKTTAPTPLWPEFIHQSPATQSLVNEVYPATLRIRPLVKYRWSLTPARVISGTHYEAHQDQPGLASP